MTVRYEKIAHDLREHIASGEFPQGTALPLMRDIAAHYGVSDITVRKAYALLTREGLLESRGRGGVFVKAHPVRMRLTTRCRATGRDEPACCAGPEGLHWRTLPYPGAESARVMSAPVPADIAKILGVPAGGLRTVRKTMSGDPGRAEYRHLADSWTAPWVPEEVPGLADSSGAGSVWERVEEWTGRALTWREEVSARMPSPGEARLLLMPPAGVPLLRTVRVALLAGSRETGPRVVEVQDIRMSAAHFALAYPVEQAA